MKSKWVKTGIVRQAVNKLIKIIQSTLFEGKTTSEFPEMLVIIPYCTRKLHVCALVTAVPFIFTVFIVFQIKLFVDDASLMFILLLVLVFIYQFLKKYFWGFVCLYDSDSKGWKGGRERGDDMQQMAVGRIRKPLCRDSREPFQNIPVSVLMV